jgi:hypothetical protein
MFRSSVISGDGFLGKPSPELALSLWEKRALWRRLEARFLEDWRFPQSDRRSEPISLMVNKATAAFPLGRRG